MAATHAEVHERRAVGVVLYAAVIDGLAEGEYRVWPVPRFRSGGFGSTLGRSPSSIGGTKGDVRPLARIFAWLDTPDHHGGRAGSRDISQRRDAVGRTAAVFALGVLVGIVGMRVAAHYAAPSVAGYSPVRVEQGTTTAVNADGTAIGVNGTGGFSGFNVVGSMWSGTDDVWHENALAGSCLVPESSGQPLTIGVVKAPPAGGAPGATSWCGSAATGRRPAADGPSVPVRGRGPRTSADTLPRGDGRADEGDGLENR